MPCCLALNRERLFARRIGRDFALPLILLASIFDTKILIFAPFWKSPLNRNQKGRATLSKKFQATASLIGNWHGLEKFALQTHARIKHA